MPEMKGKVKAKNDTTGTVPQTTVHRTHRRKVTSIAADGTLEIIHTRGNPKIMWESQKTNHTGQLEFHELVT